MGQELKVQSSSGNVFADLDLDNPEELLAKAELARKISSIIETQNILIGLLITADQNTSKVFFKKLTTLVINLSLLI